MIKAIAVDMDGTFLNSSNDYNRERFEKLFNEIQKQNIQFIVASGNQYAQLRSFFPEKEQEITFVSENGALVFKQDQLIKKVAFKADVVDRVLQFLLDLPFQVGIVLCGVSQAYILESESVEFKSFAKKYYYQLAEVPSFSSLPENEFVKFALNVSTKKTEELVHCVNQYFLNEVVAVSSGHGDVDLIIPGVHKGQAVQKLLEKWQIDTSELLAFGDGNNDLEMLALANESYAMKNGSKDVLKTAKYLAASNDEDGVLTVIESYLYE
ncbi:hydrolase [Tetragenococcus halophilus subsp. flandriensis]|uniref:Cof-type HAD-IIB family hydrolase n=1 Tax=Tetragenococcus halophilus TaxID=51669 RepID=UPI0023EA0C74|nr:Cof-type HAD-IIB family hydrolase [Tetragenococcus halophilus]GMA08405.1 hydrolase [Tetragenococcus halophilus subsp. flandriensis]